jgi:hypothetical protein
MTMLTLLVGEEVRHTRSLPQESPRTSPRNPIYPVGSMSHSRQPR